jgi:predicted secreted hydrolase
MNYNKTMRTRLLALFVLCIFSLSYGEEYRDVTQDHGPPFPEALFYQKDYRVQWWYFTGHLFDSSGREFGYELTFFVVGVQKKDFASRFGVNNIYISHFAVSDIQSNRFYFSDKTESGAYEFAGATGDRLKVWIDGTVLEGNGTTMHLKASDGQKSITLKLTPSKPLVLHGEKGFSRKSEESILIASYYLSYTQMQTEGSLTIGKDVFTVKGKSWFDREISSRGLSQNQAGWDWFAIQLDDNREIMLYLLRNRDGSIDRSSSGTLVSHNGRYRHLASNDFMISVPDHYRSAETGAKYPAAWEIRIPSENLILKLIPLIRDQEVLAYNSTGNYYWEGACRVNGSATGRAYVEMTGY